MRLVTCPSSAARYVFFAAALFICLFLQPLNEAHAFSPAAEQGALREPAGSMAQNALPEGAGATPAAPLILAASDQEYNSEESGRRTGATAAAESAPARQAAKHPSSATEELLGGSFIGALLFGFPYEGIGTLDFALLVLLGYLATRALNAVRGNDDEERFDASRRSPTISRIPQDVEAETEEDIRRKRIAALRPNPDAAKRSRADKADDAARPEWDYGAQDNTKKTPQAPAPTPPTSAAQQGDPRDNAWSRRLNGEPRGGTSAPGTPGAPRTSRVPRTVEQNAAAMWAHVSSAKKPVVNLPENAVAEGANVPDGFDVADFLEGARVLYIRLQKAWGQRDIESLRNFTTENMRTRLQSMAEKHPDPVHTDVVFVNATLQNVVQSEQQEEAFVHFSATLRTQDMPEAQESAEVWRFIRGEATGGMWHLAGIGPAQ